MKLTREELTPTLLHELLEYNPVTGEMRWLPRSGEHFAEGGKHTREGKAIQWNGRFAGRAAFLPRNSSGYLHGTIMTVFVQAHRVAWALHYGEWPNGMIDHINGDPSDNRITNLRVVDTQGNARNMARTRRNTSGVPGVVWHKRDQKWFACIRLGERRKYLGYYDTFEGAVAARRAAERQYGFHENHGRREARSR